FFVATKSWPRRPLHSTSLSCASKAAANPGAFPVVYSDMLLSLHKIVEKTAFTPHSEFRTPQSLSVRHLHPLPPQQPAPRKLLVRQLFRLRIRQFLRRSAKENFARRMLRARTLSSVFPLECRQPFLNRLQASLHRPR